MQKKETVVPEKLDFNNMYKVLYLPTLARSIKYYRIESFVKYMRQDIDSTVAVFTIPELPEDYNSWELQVDVPEVFHELEDLVSKADIIITQATHTQKGVSFLYAVKEKYGVPIYAEFDDDPYSIAAQHPSFDKMSPGSLPELWADDLVQMVDGLFVATDYLAKKLAERTKKPIHVIPNGIDFDVWDNVKVKKRPKKLENKINIGWVGGGNHSEDLELIERPIKHVLDKYKNVTFTIAVGNEVPYYFRNNKQIIPYDFNHWVDISEYPQFFKNLHIDIGVAPLRDRLHNRAKSNLKWLEFGACGIPMIGSKVEPYLNAHAILVNSEVEWVSALEKLINDKGGYGETANKLVRRKYDVSKIAGDYLTLIKKTIDEHKGAAV